MEITKRSENSLCRKVPAERRAFVGLDLIRFAAACCVMFYHYAYFSWHEPISDTGLRAAIGTPVAFPGLVPASWWGWVGVEVFFTISGFVISMSAERQFPAAFLRNRVLRLMPALWFFASLSLIVTLVFSSAPLGGLLTSYLRSVVLFPKGPWIDGAYWTLTIEVIFYAAMLLIIATGWLSRLRGIVIGASLVIFSFHMLVIAARLWPELPLAGLIHTFATSYASRVLLLTTGAYFIVGVGIYLLYRDGWHGWTASALCMSLVAGAIGIWLFAEPMTAVTEHGQSPASPVVVWLGAVLLLVISLRWHRASKDGAAVQSAARSLGLATYPLYLFHNIAGGFLFGMLLRSGIGAGVSLAAAMTIGAVISIGFALWVEPRCRKALARILDRRFDVFLTGARGRDRT